MTSLALWQLMNSGKSSAIGKPFLKNGITAQEDEMCQVCDYFFADRLADE